MYGLEILFVCLLSLNLYSMLTEGPQSVLVHDTGSGQEAIQSPHPPEKKWNIWFGAGVDLRPSLTADNII